MARDETVLVGATALVGTQLRPLRDSVVTLRGKHLGAIRRRSDGTVPETAKVEEVSGLTLLPGFIDTHVHIALSEPREVVAGGVTTVRDLGWPGPQIFDLVERSRREGFDGPTIMAAGQILTAPGGYPARAAWAPRGTAAEIADPPAAREVVAEMKEAGACVIKVALNPPVGPTLDAETLTAIVDAARSHGLRVTAHVFGIDELRKAITTGVDELAHMLLSPEAIPADTLAEMVRAEMVVVPTLSIFAGAARRIAVDNLRRFLDAGGRVLYGTDLGNSGPLPGIDAREVAAMSAAGMSGSEIIAAATTAPARWVGAPAIGSLEEGNAADIVAIEGDPARDATALTRVARVWRGGAEVTARAG